MVIHGRERNPRCSVLARVSASIKLNVNGARAKDTGTGQCVCAYGLTDMRFRGLEIGYRKLRVLDRPAVKDNISALG